MQSYKNHLNLKNDRAKNFTDTSTPIDDIQNNSDQSIQNQIQLICQLWTSQKFNDLYPNLCFFSNHIYKTNLENIPFSISSLIEILFHIVSNEINIDLYTISLKILVNISYYNEIIPLFPSFIFTLCTSYFIKFAELSNEKKDSFCLDSILDILINLTSCDISCQEVKKRLTMEHIQTFYFNQFIDDSFKKKCIQIFNNILKYSNIESADFPSDQVVSFILNCIISVEHYWQIEWTLNIIILLIQNTLISFKFMGNDIFQMFINDCLNRTFLIKLFYDDDKVIEMQKKALNIISLILNVENYNFTFNVQAVVDLANDQRNEKLIITAITTLQNFADCQEHVQQLINCQVLPILFERMEMGVTKMKQAATKVLANIFYYVPNSCFDILVQTNSVRWLTDKLFETDDVNIIYVSIKGILNFFSLIEPYSYKYNLPVFFQESRIDDCLRYLNDSVDDQNVSDAVNALSSFLANFYSHQKETKQENSCLF